MDSFGIDIPEASKWIVFGLVIFYFILITGFGTYFARFSRNINDFFYSGQRFAWWIPAISMLATGIGSYSYLKYSQQGITTGMSSAMTYTNGWFMMPLFMFGWLPIIYFAKVKSIPEYFERRFNKTARYIAVVIILCYMFLLHRLQPFHHRCRYRRHVRLPPCSTLYPSLPFSSGPT